MTTSYAPLPSRTGRRRPQWRVVDQLGALDHLLVNNAATNPYAGNVIDIDRARAASCSTAAWRGRG